MTKAGADLSATRSIELVRAAQGGDLSALDRLFGHYYERLRLIVRARMGTRLRDYLESGDVLQETFIVAVRKFDGYELRSKGEFLGWLARIAENKIREAADWNHAQKRDRRRDLALDHVRAAISSGELRLEPAALDPLPGAALEQAEELERVVAALQELTEDHREVIVQRHFMEGDGRWEQIGAAMGGRSAEAMRMLYARALMALGTVLRRQPSGGRDASES
jgi:RNA polymerase sigma-70 factor (subfamily 1)